MSRYGLTPKWKCLTGVDEQRHVGPDGHHRVGRRRRRGHRSASWSDHCRTGGRAGMTERGRSTLEVPMNSRGLLWLLNETLSFKQIPPPMDYEGFGKLLLTCACGDGRITAAERALGRRLPRRLRGPGGRARGARGKYDGRGSVAGDHRELSDDQDVGDLGRLRGDPCLLGGRRVAPEGEVRAIEGAPHRSSGSRLRRCVTSSSSITRSNFYARSACESSFPTARPFRGERALALKTWRRTAREPTKIARVAVDPPGPRTTPEATHIRYRVRR